MGKAIVNGVDQYNWVDEDGQFCSAAAGDTIDVSTKELARGEAIEGPRGPALVTPKAKADAAAAAASEAAKVAAETAKAAKAEADAAAAAAR